MAVTGKSYVAITPSMLGAGFPQADGIGKGLAEASVQTYLKGAPVLLNASGYIAEGASIPQAIYGFARIPGQNGASDGAKTPSVYKAKPDQVYIGTFEGTLVTSHLGASAMLSKSSSSWFLKISTGASASYNAILLGPGPRFAIGDANPEVLFTLISSKIQMDS